jgi:hypothetical protein
LGGPAVDGVAFWVELVVPVAPGAEEVVVPGPVDPRDVGAEEMAPSDGSASPGNVAGTEARPLVGLGAKEFGLVAVWAPGDVVVPLLLTATTPPGLPPPPPAPAGYARLGLLAALLGPLLPPPPVAPAPPLLPPPIGICDEAFNGPSSLIIASSLPPESSPWPGAGRVVLDSSPRALDPAGAGSRSRGIGPRSAATDSEEV